MSVQKTALTLDFLPCNLICETNTTCSGKKRNVLNAFFNLYVEMCFTCGSNCVRSESRDSVYEPDSIVT